MKKLLKPHTRGTKMSASEQSFLGGFDTERSGVPQKRPLPPDEPNCGSEIALEEEIANGVAEERARKRVRAEATSEAKSRGGAVYVYDATFWCDNFRSHDLLIEFLKENCKDWAFQREVSTSGQKHFQCRLSLKKRKRQGELASLIDAWFKDRNAAVAAGSFDLSRTSVGTANGSTQKEMFQYVTKVDSRCTDAGEEHGPWTAASEAEKEPSLERLPEDIEYEAQGKRRFQVQLDEILATRATRRSLHWIVCPTGGTGKSTWSGYMERQDKLLNIPSSLMDNPKDVMQFMMSFKPYGAYVIDCPRAMTSKKVFYQTLENVADGRLYDTRYKGKRRHQSPPHVIVFANSVPDVGMMSTDRWNIGVLNGDTLTIRWARPATRDERSVSERAKEAEEAISAFGFQFED